MMEHQMSEEVVQTLNTHLDTELKNPDRKSLSGDLVGQIHQGEQLSMDFECDDLKDFRLMVENLGVAYLRHFVEQTGTMIRPKQVVTDKLWSVHSYEGDYNPIHDHLTASPMGISFTTWTKVPEQIGNTEDYNLYNSSGAIDGFINFTYGLNQTSDPERLRPSQSRYVKPEEGKLLLFPSWMQHAVYPFFGKGERRTVAGNMNCFDVTEEQMKEIDDGV
tara:strand:- start:2 stop:658 length:657 start_codon:yes stop_codon:yes gene_type:complete